MRRSPVADLFEEDPERHRHQEHRWCSTVWFVGAVVALSTACDQSRLDDERLRSALRNGRCAIARHQGWDNLHALARGEGTTPGLCDAEDLQGSNACPLKSGVRGATRDEVGYRAAAAADSWCAAYFDSRLDERLRDVPASRARDLARSALALLPGSKLETIRIPDDRNELLASAHALAWFWAVEVRRNVQGVPDEDLAGFNGRLSPEVLTRPWIQGEMENLVTRESATPDGR